MNRLFGQILYLFFPIFLIAQQDGVHLDRGIMDTAYGGVLLEEARILLSDYQLEKSLEKAMNAQSIYIATLGSVSERVADCSYLISTIHLKRRRYDDATRAADNALDIRLKDLDEPGIDVASVYVLLGEILLGQRKFNSAIQHLETAVDIYHTISDEGQPHIAMPYYHLGNIYRRQGKYDLADKSLNKALEIQLSTIGGGHPDVANTYNLMGAVFYAQGDYIPMQEYWEKSLELRLNTLKSTDPKISDSYNNLGIGCYTLGDYDRALQYHEKALDLQIKNLDSLDARLGNTHNSIGLAHRSKGDFRKAAKHFELSLIIKKNALGEYHPRVASSYDNWGNNYKDMGRYDLALQHQEKALDIRLSTLDSSHPIVANSYNNLGATFFHLEDYDRAIAFYKKSLSIRLKVLGESNPAVAECYMNLGLVYEALNEYNRAMQFYKKSLEVDLENFPSNHSDIADNYLNMAVTLRRQKKYDLSIQYTRKSLDITLDLFGAINPDVAASYNNIGRCYYDQGKFKVAIDYFHKALTSNRYSNLNSLDDVGSIPYLITTLQLLGLTYQNTDNHRDKSKRLLESRKWLDNARSTLMYLSKSIDTYDKSQLARLAHSVYDAAISTEYLLGELSLDDRSFENAFTFAEYTKSHFLFESMQEVTARNFAGLSDSLLEREYDLRYSITANEKMRRELLNSGLSNTDTAVSKIGGVLFDLKRSYQQLRDRFEKEYPDYYRLKYDLQTVNVEDIQESILSSDQTLVEYFVGIDYIFVFVINRENFKLARIEKDFPLEKMIEDFRRTCDKKYYQASIEDYCRLAYELYQKLLAPFSEDLKEKLIIVPDGVLSYLPFEALLVASVSNPNRWTAHHYLLKDKEISYTYSVALLNQMKQKKHKQELNKAFVAFAPYYDGNNRVLEGLLRYGDAKEKAPLQALPSSGKEVFSIRKIVGGDIYYHKDATENKFLDAAANYRIVHLATHARANDKEGDYSYLAFTELKDSLENELLYVRDLYNLELVADMVVLSACESGIGQLKRGEGMIGLTRGFTFAGAKSIITSLWSVMDESTSDLMIAFYENLQKGMTKDQALRIAKLDYIWSLPKTEGSLAHPFFWSSFIAVGDMSPIDF